MAREILSDAGVESLEKLGAADFAHNLPDVGRFRVNVFKQRGVIGIVFRHVLPTPPEFEEIIMKLLTALDRRGGKLTSTALARAIRSSAKPRSRIT